VRTSARFRRPFRASTETPRSHSHFQENYKERLTSRSSLGLFSCLRADCFTVSGTIFCNRVKTLPNGFHYRRINGFVHFSPSLADLNGSLARNTSVLRVFVQVPVPVSPSQSLVKDIYLPSLEMFGLWYP
jgi:hypothetical protein